MSERGYPTAIATFLVGLLCLPLAAQDSDDAAATDTAATDTAATRAAQAEVTAKALARFERLGYRQQAAILRAIERHLVAQPQPALRRIFEMRMETAELPEAPPHPPVFDPADWAKAEHSAGKAPARSVIPAGTPSHDKVRARYPKVPFLDDLHAELIYDWQRGRLELLPPLSYSQVFSNRLNGWAPGADHAVARLLARFDTDPEQRKYSDWFGHTYCDLAARAYEDVTLYDAWFSGEHVDVPDVDAIPFAWEILDQRQLRSPLSGKPRDRLYANIKRSALANRRYRTTLEAAAAAFVRAEPLLASDYALLVPRFHLRWVDLQDSPEAMAQFLASTSRDELIDGADFEVRDPDSGAYLRRTARRDELRASETLVRETALSVLDLYAPE